MDSNSKLPSQLPIYQYKRKILESIKNNRVLVISGKTGCGKSTQVPKYILQEWPKSNIAICEPRRLAATSLAIRVAQELKCKIGTTVGYQIGMESKISEKSQITYMTYGILIQQLLFETSIEYTHIILDQVHERSLEMDFTFIALKKILDTHSKKQTKVIVMSATINTSQFANYFSTNIQTKQFLKPIIKYKQEQRKRGGRGNRGRRRQDDNDLQLNVDIQFQTKGFRKAQSIELPDKSLYKVSEYFADQIKDNKTIPQYLIDEDVRIKDDTYELALRLIDQHLIKDCGDILIFVPGMFEIKTLKDMLIQSGKSVPEQIIEVHSAYSQELYQKLFVNPIKNKVIIATNIGQSSITLPFCKAVIDFCLTRKNITIKIKGYSRFETRVASKANLMQRSGRVGRISDGVVYRLIPKQLYDKLDDFDIPQIQCVSLDMVILRAKQIDQTYKSTLFEDPYEVIFNAIQPPKYQQIHEAIQYLIKQQALVLKSDKNKQNSQKFTGQDLKITPVGQFMVTMPCNIRISKMVLTSIHYGIASTMVDIAAILLTQKSFFQHEEKRSNIQEFMHSMIGYDKGDYNDFLLRQRMFSHWRKLYFQPFHYKDKHSRNFREKEDENIEKNGSKLENGIEIQRTLQQFNNTKITKIQWDWCNQRGISPWVMRDILRISQNIRQRLKRASKRVQKSKQIIENQLVILCLCIAFEDTTCQIEWKLKNSYKQGVQIQNYVSLIESEETTVSNIDEFMMPLPQPEITFQTGGFVRITGDCQTMSKLLLPRMYTKANLQNTSALYKYLASNPAKASYTYEPATVRQRVREVTILNDSINKVNIRPNHNEDYMIISDKIFDSKGKYYMGACALVQKKQLILIKMITAKKVLLQPHVSYQFYVRVTINSDTFQLPFYLRNEDIQIIKQLRRINQEDSSKKLEQGRVIQNSKRNKLTDLLYKVRLKPKIQQWTFIFNQDIQRYKRLEEEPVNIQCANQLKQIKQQQSYFQRYKKWKTQYHIDLYLSFRELTVRKASIICSKCWPSYLTVIEDLQAFCTKKKILKLNQYRGSWVQVKNILYCSRKHKIGQVLNDDEGDVEYQNIMMYYPLGKAVKFDGQEDSIKQIFSKVQEGVYNIDREKERLSQFQCKICSCNDQYQKLKRVVFQREGESQTFWKKISEHMYSKKHLENLQKFLSNI